MQLGAEPIEQHEQLGGWPDGLQANPSFGWACGGAARFIVIALPFVHAVLVAKPEQNAQAIVASRQTLKSQRMEAELAAISQLVTGETP